MEALFAFLFNAFFFDAAVAAQSWIGLAPEKLALQVAEVDATEPDFAKRVLKIARHFVDAPYIFSPLGEGPGHSPDPDPLFRTDAIDCLSLAETSLALAAKPEMPAALQRLEQIRYTDGKVDFAWRKHFPESQWIPENERAGFIKDITREVGGSFAVPVWKTVNAKIYAKRKKSIELDLPESRVPNGTFRWWMIPIDKMEEVMSRIPSGALVFIVRDDYNTIPYRISHVGIVAQNKNGTHLIHAKDDTVHRVVEMPFADVIHRHEQFVKWPAAGFSIYLPTEPSK